MWTTVENDPEGSQMKVRKFNANILYSTIPNLKDWISDTPVFEFLDWTLDFSVASHTTQWATSRAAPQLRLKERSHHLLLRSLLLTTP